MHITVESTIPDTPRVQQVRGMFDLPADKVSRLEWDVRLPLEEKLWHIGLIVGPSGCGKTTIARRLFPEPQPDMAERLRIGSVVDAFPDAMPIKDVVTLLSAVGFASPPAWLRPYSVLSTGQQFRVTLALLLAGTPKGQRIVFDEYTSVVDRTVAQIGSAALAKTVRQRG
jgi:ABC-type glutathione transport system ATPase component